MYIPNYCWILFKSGDKSLALTILPDHLAQAWSHFFRRAKSQNIEMQIESTQLLGAEFHKRNYD